MKVFILYEEYRTSERIAWVTQSQCKKKGIEVEVINVRGINILSRLIDVNDDLLVYSPYDIPLFSEYFSENVDIFMKKVAGPSLHTKKLILYNIAEVRIENGEDKDGTSAYKYTMIERIQNDVKVISNKHDISILNKDELRIETLHVDSYWAENYLYFHEGYEIIESTKEAEEKLKVIGEERKRDLLLEKDRTERNYHNHMMQIENELRMVEKRLSDLDA